MRRASPLLLAAAAGAASAASTSTPTSTPVVLSDALAARPFYGVGGISGGGATSRLLFDYPEATRAAAMDLLFTPQLGAGLQQSKVEVGADADTTNGAEAAHRHDAADGGSYTRGYEWWVLSQAVARNPAVLTSALLWAAPRLVADAAVGGGESLFTPACVAYISEWLAGAARVHNVSLSAMGAGWNEHPHNASFIKLLRAALDADPGLAATRLAASDEWEPSQAWKLAGEMAADADLKRAVDYVSVHVAGVVDGHNDPPPPAAVALGTPLWQGEEHFGVPDSSPTACWQWPAAAALAVQINQNWVLSSMSATVLWPHTYGWSAGIIYRGKGLLAATAPWAPAGAPGAGAVTVCTPLWVAAHTTHFTGAVPGSWWLLNGTGSGFLAPETAGRNVSYVTYVGPEPSGGGRRNFTLVVESMSFGPLHARDAVADYTAAAAAAAASAPTVTATFTLAGSLVAWAGAELFVWHTNTSVTFEPAGTVTVAADGSFALTVEPLAVYTLTTVASSNPGAAAVLAALGPAFTPSRANGSDAPAPVDAPFPLPWADDYEGYANDSLPLYHSDMFGAFATWETTADEAGLPRAAERRVGGGRATVAAAAGALACSDGDSGSAALGGPASAAARPGRCTTRRRSAGAPNQVLRQYVRQAPIGWNTAAAGMATLLGNFSMPPLALAVAALIETPTPPVPGGDDMRRGVRHRPALPLGGAATGDESVYLCLRGGSGTAGGTSPSAFYGSYPDAYTWRLWANGSWALHDGITSLAAGALPAPFGYDAWHDLAFSDAPAGDGSGAVVLSGAVDGAPAFAVRVPAAATGAAGGGSGRAGPRAGGYVALGTGVNRAQWDDLALTPVAAPE